MKQTKKRTELVRVCNRCGTRVKKTTVTGYRFYCPECDEDLYEFETETKKKTRRFAYAQDR